MLLSISNRFPVHVPAIGEEGRRKSIVRERRFCLNCMGSEGAEVKALRKLRLLGLHGFRTSGEILKKQLAIKWPECVLEKMDIVCVDAPFPSDGKSSVDGFFDPPYYEWFQFNKEHVIHQNFDECVAYVEDCMIKHGPFDGLLGFSQGGFLAAALPGLQQKGKALTKVAKIKLVVIIAGAKIRNQSLLEIAYPSPTQCRSVHFLGERDLMKRHSSELIESYVDPMVIRHPNGHTIPRFDNEGLKGMLGFLERVQKEVEDEKLKNSLEDDDVIKL